MRSENIWAAFVLKPTQASLVGSMDGNSTTLGGWGKGGRSIRLIMRSVNSPVEMHITSAMDTSIWAPRPVRRALVTAASPLAAPYAPLTHSAIRPPACTG